MPLPQGTEPLILADGTKINPLNGGVLTSRNEVVVEVPTNRELQHNIVNARKRIADLPVPPDQMNTLSLVLSYTLFGLGDRDIAAILSVDVEQIQNIKMNDAYNEIKENMIATIVDSDSIQVRDMFALNSINSAKLLVDTVNDPELGHVTRMTAANNILDRAGHRPADVIEHKHKIEGGLTIKHIRKEEQDIPIVINHEGLL